MKLLDTTRITDLFKDKLNFYQDMPEVVAAASLYNISVMLSQKPTMDDKAALREVLRRIEEKNSWGKQELKMMILDILIEKDDK